MRALETGRVAPALAAWAGDVLCILNLSFKMVSTRAGEMAQPEVLSSNPSNYLVAHNHL